MSAKTLSEYLELVGVKVAAAAPVKTAAPAAPAKVASKPEAKGAPKGAGPKAKDAHMPDGGESASGHEPRADHTEHEKNDTGGTAADKATPHKIAGTNFTVPVEVIKCAEQKYFLDAGVFIADPAQAKAAYAAEVKAAEMAKYAELEKYAENERLKGALQYHGMVAESTAIKLATGEADAGYAHSIETMLNLAPGSIQKRADAMRDGMRASMPVQDLVDGRWGTAARINSETQMAATRNENTTGYEPEGVSGTRGPVTGNDEKLERFTDTWTLPGNPGLNHGQKVDQGKAYNSGSK